MGGKILLSRLQLRDSIPDSSSIMHLNPGLSDCGKRGAGSLYKVGRPTEQATQSAHWPPLSRPSLRAPGRLPRHAPPDPVPRPAPTAPHHGAAPEAEQDHTHPEAQRTGPCGDPTGERVQVRPGERDPERPGERDQKRPGERD